MPDAITDALSLQVLHSSPTFARPRGSGFYRLSQTVRVTGSFPTQARFVVAPPLLLLPTHTLQSGSWIGSKEVVPTPSALRSRASPVRGTRLQRFRSRWRLLRR